MSRTQGLIPGSVVALVAAFLSGSASGAVGPCSTAQFGGVGNSVVFYGSVGTALADFNNDNKLDLVTIDPGGNSPALLLGDGKGGFGPPTVFPVSSDFPVPLSLVVADFNGDGKPDIAIGYSKGMVSADHNGIVIFLGDGAGGFSAPSYIPLPDSVDWLGADRFTASGNMDLVAFQAGNTQISIFPGDGSGGFGSPLSFPFDGKQIAVANFAGDSKPDLAVVDTDRVSILINDGTGHFGAPVVTMLDGSHPGVAITAGDFNHDTHMDVAVSAAGDILVFTGDGSGALTLIHTIPSGARNILHAVLVGADANLDLVFASTLNNEYVLSVLKGDGSGGFGSRKDYPSLNLLTDTMSFGDLNGDTSLDLVMTVLSGSQDATATFLGDGSGGFRSASALPAIVPPLSSNFVAAGDFKEDLNADVVVSGPNNLLVYPGNGSGGFGSPVLSAGFAGIATAMAVADFNNDHHLDVVAAIGSQLAFFAGDGAGNLAAPTYTTAPATIYAIATADFNGDGKPDLAVLNFPSSIPPPPAGTLSIFLGDGSGGFSGPTNFTVAFGTSKLVIADFNGDGMPDIAVLEVQSVGGVPVPGVGVLLATGPGTFGPPSFISVASTPPGNDNVFGLVSADFNSDGKADLAVFRQFDNGGVESDVVLTLLGDGAGGFAAPIPSPAPTGNGTGIVGAADFNGDGKPDIVLSVNGIGAGLLIMRGTGTGTFQPADGFLTGQGTGTGLIADLNGDCKPDVVMLVGEVGLASFVNSCSAIASTQIAGAAEVCAGSTGNMLSVPDAGIGATYDWFVSNATITGGAGTRTITYTAGSPGPIGFSVEVVSGTGCALFGTFGVTADAPVIGTISAATMVLPASTGNTATVADAGPGATYLWTIQAGAVSAGAGTNSITYTAGSDGSVILNVSVTTPGGCNATGSAVVPILSGDYNGDGHADLFWRNASSGKNYIWFLSGGTFSSAATVVTEPDLAWKIAGTADFDGDGSQDILWRRDTGEVRIWLMSGSTMLSSVDLPAITDATWKIVATGDFNNDGKADILWRRSSTGENYVWFMNGTAVSGAANLQILPDATWQIVGTGDFNGDGHTDIVWRNSSSGMDYVWFMNGTTFAGAASLDTVSDTNWKIVGIADFNGDGHPDILWRRAVTGDDYIWFLNGATVTGSSSLPSTTDATWGIVGPK